MNYKETGFRALYKNFAAFMLKDNLMKCIEGFPGSGEANCILTYGYIDREAGMTLEILCAGIKDGDRFSFFECSDEYRAILRVGSIEDDDFYLFDNSDGRISKKYEKKLNTLAIYKAPEEVEESRKMSFLDQSRHEHYPDDVMVYLTKKGLDPEGCWVRIIGLGEHYIIGKLLNEPNQDFGCHEGDRVAFYVQQQEDKSVILYTDMTPSRKLSAEELEDGTLLKKAISVFNKERTEGHFIEILELLRDSFVWVPCNAVIGDADKAELEKAVQEAGDDLSSMVGKTFSSKENIRMIPDILQNGDEYFFPIFTSIEDMGEYGEHFSKIQKHILEVIPLARNNEKKVSGIVLNAFSEPFVLNNELFDMVENMKSRLE